ncbi:MAG: proline dehydrogenase family protein [Deltaproteobacteria bacterium]|nr:proline dehydrogenase family protein [Deltaproteobacteria bacterium]MBW2152128.1 proline dehydrogenase family protein [Deltaproteobacteria bacterium]
MAVLKKMLLWGSENQWLKYHVPNYRFMQKAVKRFMPGEKLEDALREAQAFNTKKISSIFTYLGENITDLSEAESVTKHYLEVLDKISEKNLPTEISLKLTQIGLDLSVERTFENFKSIVQKSHDQKNQVWIDMEGSAYTDLTIDFYRRIKLSYENVGLCLQAYLYRTDADISNLLELFPKIRLVKGAYKEPPAIAFKRKKDVDQNFFKLAKKLLKASQQGGIRAAFATHDIKLITKIENFAKEMNLSRENLEFQMLFGIKTAEQTRLSDEGYKLAVLIAYGDAWFPWYMRRLAERPANLTFVLKNLFTS